MISLWGLTMPSCVLMVSGCSAALGPCTAGAQLQAEGEGKGSGLKLAALRLFPLTGIYSTSLFPESSLSRALWAFPPSVSFPLPKHS